jgi:hypothetical protein
VPKKEQQQRTGWLVRWRERRREKALRALRNRGAHRACWEPRFGLTGARAAYLGVAAAILLTGCGSSGHKASTTASTPRSSTAGAANPPPSGIRARLLTKNELAGFNPVGVSVYKTPSDWISAGQVPSDQATAEKAMLSRDGFRIGVHEDLMSAGTGGASIVEQFRSPAAARDALAFYVSQSKASAAAGFVGAYAPFKVSGIPGAVGFSLGGVNGGGINIVFSDGAYYYLVGQERGSQTAIANLTAAAQDLYHRVHG